MLSHGCGCGRLVRRTLADLKAQDMPAGTLQEMVNRLHYAPVFTAHPTEARRRAVMEGMRRIFLICDELYNPALGVNDRRELEAQLAAEIQVGWRTDELRNAKLEVRDEVRNGLYYVLESLFEAVPKANSSSRRRCAIKLRNADGTATIACRLHGSARGSAATVRHPFVTAESRMDGAKDAGALEEYRAAC